MARVLPDAGELEVRVEASLETVFAFFADNLRTCRRTVVRQALSASREPRVTVAFMSFQD